MSERNKAKEQKTILSMGLSGVLIAIVILALGWFFCSYTAEESILTRLDMFVSSLLLPTILIVVLVINVGQRRFDASEAVRDGCSDESIRIHQSLLTNTIEQTLIFVMFLLFFTIKLDVIHLYMIYIYTVVFLLGRLVFIAGYLIEPIYRATGFAMNITAGFIVICLMLLG